MLENNTIQNLESNKLKKGAQVVCVSVLPTKLMFNLKFIFVVATNYEYRMPQLLVLKEPLHKLKLID